MTFISRNDTIALSHKEFELLETVHRIGPCSADKLVTTLNESDLSGIIRMLHDLNARSLIVRAEIEEQLLYDVKNIYQEVRRRFIVLPDL